MQTYQEYPNLWANVPSRDVPSGDDKHAFQWVVFIRHAGIGG